MPAAETASSAGAPRPQPGHGKRGGFSRFLRGRRGRIALLVAGAVLVLAIVGLLLFFFLGRADQRAAESGIPSDISRSENSTDLAYDKDADRIDESKTIRPFWPRVRMPGRSISTRPSSSGTPTPTG